RELLRVLDEEMDWLPDKYRAPLLLCSLEGVIQDEAARQLGCSVSTLKRRLEYGRELLRDRLARRGVTLSGGLLAVTVASGAPAALARATFRAALGPADEYPAAAVTGFVERAAKTVPGFRVRMAALVAVALGVAAAGAGLAIGHRSERGAPVDDTGPTVQQQP